MKLHDRPYTSNAILAMGTLSILCSITVLTLFILFISLSKPSFHDLNKFDFATLGLDFFLTLLYGILTFMKDHNISKYGTKTWLTALILFTIVITHNVVALYQHHSYVLLTIALAIPIGISSLIISVNSYYYFNEAIVPDVFDEFTSPAHIEEFSDYEEEESKGYIKKVVNPPLNSIVKNHLTVDSKGRLNWRKTHFMLAIENNLTVKKRWKQIMGGIKHWLNTLPSPKDALISIFSFDVIGHNPKLYKVPSEMVEAMKEVFPFDNSAASLDGAINTFEEVLKNKEGKSLKNDEWLHYGVIIAASESTYKEETLEEFMKFKERNDVKFFLNAITQISKVNDINKLVIALEGVHYTINHRANFGKAFTEAMLQTPLESNEDF